MDKDQALDVLRRGMSTELWGQRFYREAVQHTSSVDGKKVFQSLVDEEGKHLDILRREYAIIAGDNRMLSMEEAEAMAAQVDPSTIFPQAQAGRLIAQGTSDEQALEMAMAFEQRGFQVYQTQAAQTTSPRAKAMWEMLAKAEDMHFAFLQETLEYLQTNGVWYFDENELPFFEG